MSDPEFQWQRPDDAKFYESLKSQGKTRYCKCSFDWRYNERGERYPQLLHVLSCPVHYPLTSKLFGDDHGENR